MVERSPEAFDSKVGWLNTESGITVKEMFRSWHIKKREVDPVIAILTLDQKLEAMCDFFEANHAKLKLGWKDKLEVGRIWREAAQHLQKENDRNAHLFANGES